jgi:hypothetical protein
VDHSIDELLMASSDFYFMMDQPNEGDTRLSSPPCFATWHCKKKCVAAAALPRSVKKSDGKAATVASKKDAAQYAKLEAVPDSLPGGSHQANGEIENVVMQVERRQRALRSSLEAKLGFALEDEYPAVAWAPTFAANQMITEDGRSLIGDE